MSSDKKLTVFVSYSHKDKAWLERVQVHLTPLAQDGKLNLWDDTRIKTGERWREEIKVALARADVAVLLISADFFASDFIAKHELPPLLEAARSERGLIIAGVHINYSRFDRDKVLSEYQTVNTPDRPIEGRSKANQEKVFDALARRIEDLVPARSAAPEIPPEYLKWLEGRCASVELLGQDIQKGHAFTLSHVYVPAVIQWDPAFGSERNGWTLVSGEIYEPVPLLECIDRLSLYVPAAAGAGKSTFCRWAALQSISGAARPHPVLAPQWYQERVPASLCSRIPLLVPLREFWTAMPCGRGQLTWYRSDLEQALATWIDGSPPPGLSGALLREHLRAGSAFLLLDGLDEVPVSEPRDRGTVYPRKLLVSGLADALPAWEAAGNRTLLTSRRYGLDQADIARLGLLEAPLEPMPDPIQDLFVTRWFHTVGRQELTSRLLDAIHQRNDLAPLAENPMLLTAMCVLYDKGGHLPEDSYNLYKSIVDGVLHSRYPGDAREREPVRRRLEAIAYGMHTGKPDGSHRQTPAAEISWNETERLLLQFADRNPAYGRGEIDAAVQRDELLSRSGLLLPRPSERAAFYHLSFQEFLAAERIARGNESRVTEVIDARVSVSEWRPTLLFLFAAQIYSKDPEWGLDLLARLLKCQDRTAVKDNPAPAVFIAEALELCLAKRYQIPKALADSFRRLSLDAIEDELEVRARQALGLCLGRLGDPRIFDLRDPRAYVEVPAGIYPYGETGETVEIAAPFRIGRYPVTNSQYRAFLDDDGYGSRQWWSETGWTCVQEHGITEPALWHDRRWNSPNQPVVGVSFFEAEACCAWAGGRLPPEQDWEASARGPEGCEYPWCGDWKTGICNGAGAGLSGTSPVGLFPRSRQPRLSLDDLAGNVWEWCWPLAEDPEGERVVRGGSWLGNPRRARCASRYLYLPNLRLDHVGFRVVCSSPIKDG